MDPSESLRALQEWAEVRREIEAVERILASLERELVTFDPESDEARNKRSEIQGIKARLEALNMQCGELKALYEKEPVKAQRQEEPPT